MKNSEHRQEAVYLIGRARNQLRHAIGHLEVLDEINLGKAKNAMSILVELDKELWEEITIEAIMKAQK